MNPRTIAAFLLVATQVASSACHSGGEAAPPADASIDTLAASRPADAEDAGVQASPESGTNGNGDIIGPPCLLDGAPCPDTCDYDGGIWTCPLCSEEEGGVWSCLGLSMADCSSLAVLNAPCDALGAICLECAQLPPGDHSPGGMCACGFYAGDSLSPEGVATLPAPFLRDAGWHCGDPVWPTPQYYPGTEWFCDNQLYYRADAGSDGSSDAAPDASVTGDAGMDGAPE